MHTSTLDRVNPGVLYRDQDKIKEAEDTYVRALTGYENSWGAEHKRPLHMKLNTHGRTIPLTEKWTVLGLGAPSLSFQVRYAYPTPLG